MLKNYLVQIKIQIVEYEKQSNHALQAKSEEEAGTQALYDECHDKPDFDDYPDKQGCWDCGEMLYTVSAVKQLSERDFAKYKEIVYSVFY